MRKANDLTGQKFGRLTAVEKAGKYRDRHILWLCECECGNTCQVPSNVLKKGEVRSCGCLLREAQHIPKNKKHGLSKSRIYQIWRDMRARCENENNKRYHRYGERGIKVCDEWRSDFRNFYEWAVENGYNETLTIDRKDNEGNYEPSNCRWLNKKEQNNNTSRNNIVEYNGEKHTVAEWADILNIKYQTLSGRIRAGWSIEKAVTQPVEKR